MLTSTHGEFGAQDCYPQKCREQFYEYRFMKNWWMCKTGQKPKVCKYFGELHANRHFSDCKGPQLQCASGTSANQPTGTAQLYNLDRLDQRRNIPDGKYSVKLDGSGVHVYVLDSGIRTTHEDFQDRAIPEIETHLGKRKVCKDKSDIHCAYDVNGHGSHCAGTVGGKVAGVAKGATIHACKVMAVRTATTTSIMLAVDWVAFNGSRPAVISASLGRPDHNSPSLTKVFGRAYNRGVISVVAAGNDGKDACTQTPASVEKVITVGAVDAADTRANQQPKGNGAFRWSSNYGKCVDIWAPGADIISARSEADIGWRMMSGTSMATPAVAGAAALLLQANPTLPPADTTRVLKEYGVSSVLRGDLGEGSPNLMLFVTQYSTTSTTTMAPPPNQDGGKTSSRRRGSRRRGSGRRRGKSTRRRRRRRRRRRSDRRRKR